jgi:UDP-N-acetylmuramate--alanine ligase
VRHVHLIGVGGAGMSGLAEVLLARKITVSGSDLASNEKTKQLKKHGAQIFIGHDARHIAKTVDTVVFTSAVDPANPELLAALRLGLPVIRRAEFLHLLTKELKTIAVAGTHGKTTTTSMIAHILIEAGLDPLVFVGAAVKELNGKNARPGGGAIAIVEADEYDRSFLALAPYIAVITSLEPEHLDIYKDIDDLEQTFLQFANNTNDRHLQGFAIINIDEPSLRKILPKLTKRVVSYGVTSPEAKYKAVDIRIQGLTTQAKVIRGHEEIGELFLNIAGMHNIQNALAAIAVVEVLAIPFELTLRALATFKGAERRLDVIGEKHGVLVIDDYAHHPTEVRATLSTLRSGFPNRKIIAAFQPHTFTRTRDFAKEFGKVFAEYADELFLLDIYPARETPIRGVTSALILDAAKQAGLKKAVHVEQLDHLPRSIVHGRRTGDIIITMGAGTINTVTPAILERLS